MVSKINKPFGNNNRTKNSTKLINDGSLPESKRERIDSTLVQKVTNTIPITRVPQLQSTQIAHIPSTLQQGKKTIQNNKLPINDSSKFNALGKNPLQKEIYVNYGRLKGPSSPISLIPSSLSNTSESSDDDDGINDYYSEADYTVGPYSITNEYNSAPAVYNGGTMGYKNPQSHIRQINPVFAPIGRKNGKNTRSTSSSSTESTPVQPTGWAPAFIPTIYSPEYNSTDSSGKSTYSKSESQMSTTPYNSYSKSSSKKSSSQRNSSAKSSSIDNSQYRNSWDKEKKNKRKTIETSDDSIILYYDKGFSFPIHINKKSGALELKIRLGSSTVIPVSLSTVRRTLTLSSKEAEKYHIYVDQEDFVCCYPGKKCQLYSTTVDIIGREPKLKKVINVPSPSVSVTTNTNEKRKKRPRKKVNATIVPKSTVGIEESQKVITAPIITTTISHKKKIPSYNSAPSTHGKSTKNLSFHKNDEGKSDGSNSDDKRNSSANYSSNHKKSKVKNSVPTQYSQDNNSTDTNTAVESDNQDTKNFISAIRDTEISTYPTDRKKKRNSKLSAALHSSTRRKVLANMSTNFDKKKPKLSTVKNHGNKRQGDTVPRIKNMAKNGSIVGKLIKKPYSSIPRTIDIPSSHSSSNPIVKLETANNGTEILTTIHRCDLYVSDGKFPSRLGLMGTVNKRSIFTHLKQFRDLFCICLEGKHFRLRFGERAIPSKEAKCIRLLERPKLSKPLFILPLQCIRIDREIIFDSISQTFPKKLSTTGDNAEDKSKEKTTSINPLPAIVHLEIENLCLPNDLFFQCLTQIQSCTGLFSIDHGEEETSLPLVEDSKRVSGLLKKFPTISLFFSFSELGQQKAYELMLSPGQYLKVDGKNTFLLLSCLKDTVVNDSCIGNCIILGNCCLRGRKTSFSLSGKSVWFW